MKKKDIILAAGICLLAGICWLIAQFLLPRDSHTIQITVDGELYGEYSLDQDQEIAIGETNRCRIQNGEVKMIEADCPDQLCVHQHAVDERGGSIICLPNRVVITSVRDSEQDSSSGDVDAVV